MALERANHYTQAITGGVVVIVIFLSIVLISPIALPLYLIGRAAEWVSPGFLDRWVDED